MKLQTVAAILRSMRGILAPSKVLSIKSFFYQLLRKVEVWLVDMLMDIWMKISFAVHYKLVWRRNSEHTYIGQSLLYIESREPEKLMEEYMPRHVPYGLARLSSSSAI